MVKNYMELLVSETLKDIIKDYDICTCDDCINDIKSIALNNLPPVYFLSSIDEGQKKAFLLDRQRKISVLAKVAEAIQIVSNNSHNKGNKKMRESL
ncbi:competence protein ComFB [Anaerosalibacter bizertensis]|uniref:Competence protein ComFB n=1 Tax=Anaerosalibacter bizertensis TaxID=932217 RepID=A0A844FHS9_9FIRM|nr:late competence development ComFB family protein [Anaerosalibacter bizertensis]MBV1820357.1 late competence development ComFB family protein [Bacteroidales bacterium MSK.15.36]HHV27130.1 late competence development ComFB family protein [Tissierellia bacterium]MBU5294274.1 late competence development ComFB family protein [Anaerosalibacter bizertensis]MCB5560489.1 late competence development ComFB family protein [Anaerosalibacter bizertensis]MCG4565320.1 late competence development ComFB fami